MLILNSVKNIPFFMLHLVMQGEKHSICGVVILSQTIPSCNGQLISYCYGLFIFQASFKLFLHNTLERSCISVFPLLYHILSYFTASKRSRPGGATCYSQGILKQFHSPTKFPEKRIRGICLVEYSQNIFASNLCLFCQLHCIHAR